MAPIQKIIFGSPGTGKSYQIREIAKNKLGIETDPDTGMLENTVKAVFHPEYTYADFIGKLLPLTTTGNLVIYKFYPGHFMRILGMAYGSILNGNEKNHLFVIDELNRGNAAAIFGSVFQLLDRENDGWSSYEFDLSDMELQGLLHEMEYKNVQQITIDGEDKNIVIRSSTGSKSKSTCREFFDKEAEKFQKEADKLVGGFDDEDGVYFYDLDTAKQHTQKMFKVKLCKMLAKGQIKLPPNLSIIATINTSDESIFYLDSAFKRRWDWKYQKAPDNSIYSMSEIPESLHDIYVDLEIKGKKQPWYIYVIAINEFIKSNHHRIRRVEDKQIGWWFIKQKNNIISIEQVKDKLMFYLWDSVFPRDKQLLEALLSDDTDTVVLRTYADFVELTELFLNKVISDYGIREFDLIPF